MATTSNLVSIKDAIAWAHDDMMNKRALNVKDFEDLGLTKQAHEQWVAYVSELKEAVDTYNDITQAKDTLKAFKAAKIETEKEVKDKQTAIDIVTGRVWSTWRSVVKEGSENEFNKRFFIYETDLPMIIGFCGLGTINTKKGKQFDHKQEADFRKMVETCIGIRMAGNGMLSDATRDVVLAYESAVKKIDTNKALLADSKDKDGRTIAGLESNLKLTTIKLDEQTKMLDELGIDAEKKATILKSLQTEVDTLTTKVKDAKKAITDNEEIRDKNQKAYDKAIALLKSAGIN